MQEQKEHLLAKKIAFTVLILLIYILGKSLPLAGVDYLTYQEKSLDSAFLLSQTIGGDANRISLFALGLSPYMMSMILVQIGSACMRSDARAKTSPRKRNRVALFLMLGFSIFQAILQIRDLQFLETLSPKELFMAKGISVIEMVTGAVLILWLCERNKKYGIGGQTAIIFVNLTESMLLLLEGYTLLELAPALALSLLALFVTVLMENAEKRIPVQRISIHNIYADKNYMAIKLNPIGVMPAMFATAFFMIPQLLVKGLCLLFPGNMRFAWWGENLTVTHPLGIAGYLLVLFALTVGFSRVFINPSDITEQYLKSGDSLVGLHAGRETKRYLSRTITHLSFFSAFLMVLCLGIPMILQQYGQIDTALTNLPASVMMITGLWCNLHREKQAICDMDAYRTFL